MPLERQKSTSRAVFMPSLWNMTMTMIKCDHRCPVLGVSALQMGGANMKKWSSGPTLDLHNACNKKSLEGHKEGNAIVSIWLSFDLRKFAPVFPIRVDKGLDARNLWVQGQTKSNGIFTGIKKLREKEGQRDSHQQRSSTDYHHWMFWHLQVIASQTICCSQFAKTTHNLNL